MQSADEAASLQREINQWKWGLAGAAVLAVLAYAGWFGWHTGLPLADRAGSWGEFGDFLGGLLNPLVAFAAFYWLTRSVQLQKKELEETRRALEESSEAQRQQAEQGRVAVRLDALVAAHAMNIDDIAELLKRRAPLDDALTAGAMSQKGLDRIADKLAVIDGEIGDLTGAQKSYRAEIKQLLNLYPLPQRRADKLT